MNTQTLTLDDATNMIASLVRWEIGDGHHASCILKHCKRPEGDATEATLDEWTSYVRATAALERILAYASMASEADGDTENKLGFPVAHMREAFVAIRQESIFGVSILAKLAAFELSQDSV